MSPAFQCTWSSDIWAIFYVSRWHRTFNLDNWKLRSEFLGFFPNWSSSHNITRLGRSKIGQSLLQLRYRDYSAILCANSDLRLVVKRRKSLIISTISSYGVNCFCLTSMVTGPGEVLLPTMAPCQGIEPMLTTPLFVWFRVVSLGPGLRGVRSRT